MSYQQQYEIGQLIFLYENGKVLPAKIEEVIIRNTASGQKFSYIISFGPVNDRKKMDIRKVQDRYKLFSTLNEVRKEMYSALLGVVKEVSDNTREMVLSWYGKQLPPDNGFGEDLIDDNTEETVEETDLEKLIESVSPKQQLHVNTSSPSMKQNIDNEQKGPSLVLTQPMQQQQQPVSYSPPQYKAPSSIEELRLNVAGDIGDDEDLDIPPVEKI